MARWRKNHFIGYNGGGGGRRRRSDGDTFFSLDGRKAKGINDLE